MKRQGNRERQNVLKFAQPAEESLEYLIKCAGHTHSDAKEDDLTGIQK